MKIKRIAMSESDEKTFDKIKKQIGMTNDEALSFCIQLAYNQLLYQKSMNTDIPSISNESNIDSTIQKEILEYVKLLVKINKDLPTDESEMIRYVDNTSRFEKFINKKISEDI